MGLDCRFAHSIGDNACSAVSPLFDKRARDLTKNEATAILNYLQSLGKMPLYDPSKAPGKRVGQVRLARKLNGVEFWQAAGNNNINKFGSINATWNDKMTFDPNPQFAVVLYRFAGYLRSRWGATKIVCDGIGVGSGKQAIDCHVTGHCIDFYGATTTRGGTFDVRRDWYSRPVYMANGNVHPTAGGGLDMDRWGNDPATNFRLNTNKEDEKLPDDPDYFNPRARDFFLDVFQFIWDECNVSKDEISPAAMKAGSGIKAGYTMHPDYPTKMRVPHNDHIHFQLGLAFE